MRIITRRTLREFWERFPEAETQLKVWYQIVKGARYRSPADVKEQFRSASMLGGGKTVFNICGNKYRLCVTMRYDLQRVYVRDVLTHEEYDNRIRDGTL